MKDLLRQGRLYSILLAIVFLVNMVQEISEGQSLWYVACLILAILATVRDAYKFNKVIKGP